MSLATWEIKEELQNHGVDKFIPDFDKVNADTIEVIWDLWLSGVEKENVFKLSKLIVECELEDSARSIFNIINFSEIYKSQRWEDKL